MKKLLRNISKLSVIRKVQLVAAVLVTIALLIVIPTAAWFSYQREIVKIQKIKAPNVLYLSAAHREDSVNFSVTGINADEIQKDGFGNPIKEGNVEQKITHKDYVFCVTGDAVEKFTIQLAYTTNNPFTYTIYAAEEVLPENVVRENGVEFEYVAYKLTGNGVEGMPVVNGADYHTSAEADSYLYYKINTSITDNGKAISGRYPGAFLNKQSESHTADATGTYHNMTYDEYTNVQINAEPVYWQATNVSASPTSINANKDAFSRHFILRVSWEPGSFDNTTKETDMVYISVMATR